jgi:hypothetical protein
LRASTFGEALRQFHPGRRTGPPPTETLASLELNHGPAIHRTFWAFELMQHTGIRVDLGPEKEYLD